MTDVRLPIEPSVADVIRQLQRDGHEAYIVGGAVRDLLLELTPKDYDIATSARPEQVKKIFGRRAIIIGRRFRLVHVFAGGHTFEVSTFRREPTMEERSTRVTDDGVMIWDDNQWGTHAQDVVRRDFTVNAMYYDPVGECIVDPAGGVADLRAGHVRAIGNAAERLAEDPVRMLRAIKLVAQYGLRLEASLDQALREGASRITMSSKARGFEEILKIFAKPFCLPTIQICRDYGLLEHFWPGLNAALAAPEGAELERLLAERDRRVAQGVFGKSKTLALATIAYSFVAARLRDEVPDPETPFWEAHPEVHDASRAMFLDFFAPYPVPKFLSARARDVILALPALLYPDQPGHLPHHPQYRYVLELYYQLCLANGWDESVLRQWPPPIERHEPREAGHHGEENRFRHGRRHHRDRRRGGPPEHDRPMPSVAPGTDEE
jgi:poly(A) polymerase